MKMASLRFQGHPSRNTAILFLSVAAVSVAALVWMGVRLVQQDRALEARQLEEQREAAADRLIASLEQVLSAEERRLADLPNVDFVPSADDIVLILAVSSGPPGSSEVRLWPDNALLYYPVIPPGQEAPAHLYADAEKSEFLYHNYSRAIIDLRPFSKAKDPAVRVGAQLRLARNLRKAGDIDSALEIYADLTKSSNLGVSISGVPADLAARRARCVLLEELGRRSELEQEAQSLHDDLRGRHWCLDRASYLYYRDQASHWLSQELEPDAEQQALADAVVWLWQNRQAIANVERGSAGRRSFRGHGTSVTILWQASNERLAAVVAGPGYQRSRWFDPLLKGPDFSGVRVAVLDSEKARVYGNEPATESPATSRLASVTGLPWDIAIVNANLEADLNQFGQRRRLMMMGLGIVALLVIAASYLIGRAVSRELAAARLQSDFVSAVSHEFRTPLTSMRQFTEMLVEDENLPAEKRRAFYGAQERATRRLSRLVESLLDFGRMEAGARPYRLERLDPGRLVKATAEEFKQETDSKSLVMQCAVPEEGLVLKADREALAQALWNLLDNAVKYSGENPVVHVEVEAGRNQVAIRVRDQGIGISASEKDRILRKFVRGSSAKVYGVKGTGIGLAMVKHIVDAHGGKVLVASEPGKGSTFTILLPAGD
jgi:signal transduction histidine kinase